MHPLRRYVPWLALIATLSLATGRAHAQCSITGPTWVCGSPVTLCAPDGGELYEWTLPDGSHSWDQCLVASAAGTYSVRLFDPELNAWTTPCTHVLSGPGGAPAIAGIASACAGAPTDLCGPTGDFEYEWNGPAGFWANSACVSVTESGTYQLRVRPLPDGCWSDWGSHDVSFTTCSDPLPPPDPDPSPAAGNCPRAAWWWAQQCPDHDNSHVRLDPSTMAALSDCVAEHDLEIQGNFCRTMLAGKRTLESRARRQVAAVWANVCAGNLGVRSRDGRPVSLDGATLVSVGGYHGSVSEWLASAVTTIHTTSGSSANEKSARDEYKRLIRVAWSINHGIGIGSVCSPTGDAPAAGVSLLNEANALTAANDPEPLAAELMDDMSGVLSFGAIEPNPVRSRMTMAYAIATASAAEVTIGVYDVSGRMVRELVRGTMSPGEYVLQWDGRDENGAAVRGGMYFVLGRIGGERAQTRVTLVR